MRRFLILGSILLFSIPQVCVAIEHHFRGLVDIRATHTDSLQRYLDGGYGKFQYDDGSEFSLAHGAIDYRLDWDEHWSFHGVSNLYADESRTDVGVSETYFRYRGVPTENGRRWQLKAGMLYPVISLENIATAWSSPYTLNYSTLNSWIGEEFRYLGVESQWTWLGKARNQKHDWRLSLALMSHNDTAGAMLAWHGWTSSSRQSLWHERLPLPDFPARSQYPLNQQAAESDPFLELDDRVGYHVSGEWNKHGKGFIRLGYYNNNADMRNVVNGQYAWGTEFFHGGIKWRLWGKTQLIAQWMQGQTAMTRLNGDIIVDNDYRNVFAALTRKFDRHRVTFRLEDFSVTDKDTLPMDGNGENGNGLTLSYAYQWHKRWFAHVEFNRLRSDKEGRMYAGYPEELTEKQWQLGIRYYF
ncbi:hypothetical protein [Pleionea sp. CnH1-48]|uniref:hypothetical protein n=1 Tax=Pleionea sp. CnH1-48 TaxID=2954494 RepID=UPI002097B61B|nr:hypothetical protein [Pleionea sp. CnH1-48]MCO7226464.1 hypothetical protein [Pleionea sp. CnH1-48]